MSAADAIGLATLLVIILVTAMFIVWLRNRIRRADETPANRYRRDVFQLQLDARRRAPRSKRVGHRPADVWDAGVASAMPSRGKRIVAWMTLGALGAGGQDPGGGCGGGGCGCGGGGGCGGGS